MWQKMRNYVTGWFFLFNGLRAQWYRSFIGFYGSFFILAMLVTLEAGNVNRVDRAITEWIYERPMLREQWCRELTKLGDGEVIRKSCGASVFILFLLKRWNYVPPLLIGVLGQVVITRWIQNALGRKRPEFEGISSINYPAFPSGHTSAAVAFFGFWALFLLIEFRDHMIARILAVVACICALGVGVSRVFLVVHWTTDVLGGFVLAVMWIFFCFWINYKMQPENRG